MFIDELELLNFWEENEPNPNYEGLKCVSAFLELTLHTRLSA